MSASKNSGRSPGQGARAASPRKPSRPQPSLEQLLPLIENKGDAGLALSKIKQQLISRSQDPARTAELEAKLDALLRARAIHWLPTQAKKPDTLYFAAGRGPSVEKVGAAIAAFAREPGTTVFSSAHLAKKITGNDQLILDQAIKHALKTGDILSETTEKGKTRTTWYFAPERRPSVGTVSAAIAAWALQAGTTLLSKAALKKKLTELEVPFLDAAIQHNLKAQVLEELTCGTAKNQDAIKYYLHRDIAARDFGTLAPTPRPAQRPKDLAFEDLLPVYRRLKSEQRGLSTVKIFDLLKELQVPKDLLHRVLIAAAREGRATIHHSTSAELPQEVMDAGIRLEGFSEPFITVVVK